MNIMKAFLTSYMDRIIRFRLIVLALCVLSIIALASGAARLTFTSDFRTYFGPENPQLIAFENMETTFSKQENVYFFLRAKNGSVFTREGLSLIQEITDRGWTLPYSQRVDSLQNYQHTDVQDDELIIDYLYDDATSMSDEDIQRVQNIVMNEHTLLNNLISEDGTATGISVRTVLPEEDTRNTSIEAVEAARALADELRPQYPDIEIMLGGSLTSNVTMGEAIQQDIESLLLISYAVMILIMVSLLRSISGTVITLLMISFSVLSTLGLFGWLGFTMTPPTGFVPTAVMTIAVADTIHILVSYYYELAQGKKKHDAIREAMRINFTPVFITSITTMIGVLCLNTSDSPPYRDMGNMIAAGVFFAWLYTLTFLPALLAVLPAPKGQDKSDKPTLMGRFSEFVIQRHRSLFVVMGIIIVGIGSQIHNNQITERWHEFFDDSFEVRNTVEATNDHLGGIHRIFFVLDSQTEDGINDPAFLQQMDAFTQWLHEQPRVSSVNVLSDTIKRLNQNLHQNNESAYRIPENREQAAQYLFLYELSLPLGLGLDDTINNGRSATRLTVSFSKADSSFILDFEKRALEWLEQNAPAIHTQEGTGLDIVFANLTFRNISSMLSGTSVALILISFLLIFALRSLKIGLISLVPNLVPAILAYGLWAMFKGSIDTAVSVVLCLSLGIVVDDTVHFLSKYLRARKEQGLNTEDAIRYAFRTVGNALVVTSSVLVGGFLVMQFSHFNPSNDMGTLLAITIFVASGC